ASMGEEALADAVERFLATEEVLVERMTKKGRRSFDARAAVVSLHGRVVTDSGQTCAILDTVLRHGTPSVRPDDVLAALREISGLEPGPGAIQLRVAQGPLDPQA